MTTLSSEDFLEPAMRTCDACGETRPKEEMQPFDISNGEEYYPVIRYLCPVHARDDR
ncbi:hypothetical protein ACLI4U_19150 (plasmid) [Natrialbaceae archaeon A-CW2]